MNIASVHRPPGDLLATRDQAFTRPTETQTVADGRATAGVAIPPTSAVAGRPHQPSGVPVQAPAGTDPALWSILTAEERTFFARQATSGPLTYLKIMMPDAPSVATAAARGRRIDVRA